MLNEKAIEDKVMEIFRNLGYECLHGTDVNEERLLKESHTTNPLSCVILTRRLKDAIARLNPDLSEEDIAKCVKQFTDEIYACKKEALPEVNKTIYDTMTQGYTLEQSTGEHTQVRLFDFNNTSNNNFLAVRQFGVRFTNNEDRRRVADIVVFVNGIPLAIIEMKDPSNEQATLETAHKQVTETYVRDIHSLFVCNQIVVVSDGVNSKMGTFNADFSFFTGWERKHKTDTAQNDIPTKALFEEVFDKTNFVDIFENFILFSSDNTKKICRYHQYYCVNDVLNKVSSCLQSRTFKRDDKRVGILWHTQGSGKTLSMLFLLRKITKMPSSILCLFITDRKDLDSQTLGEFVRHGKSSTIKNANNIQELNTLLKEGGKRVVISTIQKFNEDDIEVSDSHNIFVIVDEAHRTQYKEKAALMRKKLPNASFLGMTGTPIQLKDRNTLLTFGEVINEYNISTGIDDGVILPIAYEVRYSRLKLNQQYSHFYQQLDGDDIPQSISKNLKISLNKILGTEKRVEKIAEDIVQHFNRHNKQFGNQGKALIAVATRENAVKMYHAMQKVNDCPQIDIVVSNYDDLRLTDQEKRKKTKEIEGRFKKADSDLKIVVVCDMWLTGFDAPHLHTLYLDKPLKGHILFQAIARVNRIFENKTRGLVVDYIGVKKELDDAIKQYNLTQNTPFQDIEALEKECFNTYSQIVKFLNIQHDNKENSISKSKKSGTADTDFVLSLYNEVITDPLTDALSNERKNDFLKLAGTFLLQYSFLHACSPRVYTLKEDMYVIRDIFSIIRKNHNLETSYELNLDINIDNLFEAGNPDTIVKTYDNIFEDSKKMEKIQSEMENVAIDSQIRLLKDEIVLMQEQNWPLAITLLDRLQAIIESYNKRFEGADDISSDMVRDELSQRAQNYLGDLKNLNKRILEAKTEVKNSHLSGRQIPIFHTLKNTLHDSDESTIEEIAKEIANNIESIITADWTNHTQISAQVENEIEDTLEQHLDDIENIEEAVNAVFDCIKLVYKDYAPKTNG